MDHFNQNSVPTKIVYLLNHLHDDVDEKVDRRIEGDQQVRNVLHHQDPVRPVVVRKAVVAVAGLEGGRDQLPDVTTYEEPDDED